MVFLQWSSSPQHQWILECVLQSFKKIGVCKVNFWSDCSFFSKCGVHILCTPKFLFHLLCTNCPLQKNWSGQLFTPISLECALFHSKNVNFLEWEAVHSKTIGVDSCPLQFFWSGQPPTPKLWCAHSNCLECI